MENKPTSDFIDSDRPAEEYEKSYIVGSGSEPGGRLIYEIDQSRVGSDGLTPEQKDIIEADRASAANSF